MTEGLSFGLLRQEDEEMKSEEELLSRADEGHGASSQTRLTAERSLHLHLAVNSIYLLKCFVQ